MASRTKLTTTYEADRVIQPIYTGGGVALDKGGRILATTLDEEALLTDLSTGELLARLDGVRGSRNPHNYIHLFTLNKDNRMVRL